MFISCAHFASCTTFALMAAVFSRNLQTHLLTAKSRNGLNRQKRETPSHVFFFLMAAKCSHCLVLISLVFFPFGVFFFFSFSAWGLRETKEGMNKGQGKRVIAAGLCHVVRKSGWNWRDQARPNSHSGRPWIVWLWQWIWTVTIAGDVSGCSSASSPCEVVLMGWCSQHFPHLPALTGSLEWQPLSFPNWHVHLDHGNWCGVAFFFCVCFS